MNGAKFCWHCGGKLVNKNGMAKPPLVFAEHKTQDGYTVRVHKVCKNNVSKKEPTAVFFEKPDILVDNL